MDLKEQWKFLVCQIDAFPIDSFHNHWGQTVVLVGSFKCAWNVFIKIIALASTKTLLLIGLLFVNHSKGVAFFHCVIFNACFGPVLCSIDIGLGELHYQGCLLNIFPTAAFYRMEFTSRPSRSKNYIRLPLKMMFILSQNPSLPLHLQSLVDSILQYLRLPLGELQYTIGCLLIPQGSNVIFWVKSPGQNSTIGCFLIPQGSLVTFRVNSSPATQVEAEITSNSLWKWCFHWAKNPSLPLNPQLLIDSIFCIKKDFIYNCNGN